MKFNKYLLVYIWAAIILFLIGTPMEEYQGDVITYYDKFAHAIIFGIFAFLLFNAKYDGQKRKVKRAFTHSFWTSVAFAAFGEVLQTMVPGRTESLLDFLAGCIGISLFLAVIIYASSTRKKT